MKKKFHLLVLISIIAISCNSNSIEVSDKMEKEIRFALENLVIGNLKHWEPPFKEEKFLQDFTNSDDFSFTLDGIHIQTFEKWKSIVYESMEYDRKNHKHYKHIVNEIQVTVLSKRSGIVTLNYNWDYITNDNHHYITNAILTSVCRYENNKWKMINSHCSHGEKRVIN